VGEAAVGEAAVGDEFEVGKWATIAILLLSLLSKSHLVLSSFNKNMILETLFIIYCHVNISTASVKEGISSEWRKGTT
jgi:hypothetical protein